MASPRAAPREDARLEREPPHREWEEALEHRAHERADQETYAHAERDAEDSDLERHEQRPDGQAPGGDAERHPDADLAALRFDDASGEVERGERGAGQDEHGEDVVEALVAIDVVVQVAVREVAPGPVERDADVREAFGQRRFELGAHDIAIGPGRELQHEVIGGPGAACDALGRVEGYEDRREVGLGEE